MTAVVPILLLVLLPPPPGTSRVLIARVQASSTALLIQLFPLKPSKKKVGREPEQGILRENPLYTHKKTLIKNEPVGQQKGNLGCYEPLPTLDP